MRAGHLAVMAQRIIGVLMQCHGMEAGLFVDSPLFVFMQAVCTFVLL